MTPHDHDAHIKRVRALAARAQEWEDQPDPYSDEGMARIRQQLERAEAAEQCHVCNCRTCGVVNARIRGALVARGWSQSAAHHVRVEGYDFRGTADPYLAAVKVGGEELHRAYDSLDELLDESVLEKVEGSLRRQGCSPSSC